MSKQEQLDVDLGAWEAPPPPAGIADRVIAKLRDPVHAAAIETAEPSRKRWWVAGGVVAAAAVVAVATVIVVGATPEPLTGSGTISVAKPSRIELGASASADLEAHTDVRWVRDGHRLVAMQPRGTASWRVGPEDKLVIDAGATVASVVASGASLRVEVHPMHVTEARLLVGSAAVSAAVALVTVVVYEGRVEVTGSGQTVTVPPGTTVEIRPHVPPTPSDLVTLEQRAEDERRRKVREAIAEKRRQFDALEQTFEAEKATLQSQPLTDEAVRKQLAHHHGALVACGGSYRGTIRMTLTIDPDGRVTDLVMAPARAAPNACVARIVKELNFGFSKGGTFRYALDLDPKTVKTVDCSDADKLAAVEQGGDEYQMNGNHAAALASYESILTCRPNLRAKAYLAACKARNFPRAKVHFKLLGKENLAQICMREGFDPR